MSDTPKTDAFKFKPEECVGHDTICSKDFARELERENARLREALEMAEKELVHLFTVLPIGGVLPSPSVMQHVQWARLANVGDVARRLPKNSHHERNT